MTAVAASAAEPPVTPIRLANWVRADLPGAGPLTPLLADPTICDVLVNRGAVWVDRGAGLIRAGISAGTPDEVRRLAQRLAVACGRRLDEGSPFVDARLPDGTRVHAVLPPIAVHGPYLSLRTVRPRAFTLGELVDAGTVSPAGAGLLAAIVAARLAYLVTGGAGSGKSTLLATLLGLVPANERIVVVEDATELRPDHPHVVGLQARTSNVEGAGEVTLRELVRQALRMRPDRLVVGECRGPEVLDMLTALNTGHEGGAATLHANTAADTPTRLETLGLLGGVSREALNAQVTSALRVVVQVVRTPSGRRVDEVCLLLARGGGRSVSAIRAWHRIGGPGPAATALAVLLRQRGVRPPGALGPEHQ